MPARSRRGTAPSSPSRKIARMPSSRAPASLAVAFKIDTKIPPDKIPSVKDYKKMIKDIEALKEVNRKKPEAAQAAYAQAKTTMNGYLEAVELLATSNVVGGSYVPPHMRGQPGGGASPAPVERKLPRGRMMKAPDISSEVYFPSLGDASDTAPKGAWGKRLVKDEGAFEEVRGGEKQGSHKATEGPKLTLGNKFDVLGAE